MINHHVPRNYGKWVLAYPKELQYLACWVNISADNILKYFSYFPQKKGFDISCKLIPKETICMKCQSWFSGKGGKISTICRLQNSPRVVKVNLFTMLQTTE